MRTVRAEEARRFVVSQLGNLLLDKGLNPDALPDDFDLLTEGVIDSLGFVELILALEKYFEVKLDFSDLDPEDLTILGPFCRHIEQKSNIADL